MANEVRIRLFATARVVVGRPSLDWPVPAGGIRASELLRQLETAHPGLRRTLRASRFLRNQRYLDDLEERLRPGDEFAVHPPYGGG
jgi:molybdopterin converting factor small subunit